MTINEIQDLIKFIAKAGVTEVEIEKQDFKITIKSPLPKRKGEAAQAEAMMQVPLSMAPVMQAPHAPQPMLSQLLQNRVLKKSNWKTTSPSNLQ